VTWKFADGGGCVVPDQPPTTTTTAIPTTTTPTTTTLEPVPRWLEVIPNPPHVANDVPEEHRDVLAKYHLADDVWYSEDSRFTIMFYGDVTNGVWGILDTMVGGFYPSADTRGVNGLLGTYGDGLLLVIGSEPPPPPSITSILVSGSLYPDATGVYDLVGDHYEKSGTLWQVLQVDGVWQITGSTNPPFPVGGTWVSDGGGLLGTYTQTVGGSTVATVTDNS
jgi:hypothetical protein